MKLNAEEQIIREYLIDLAKDKDRKTVTYKEFCDYFSQNHNIHHEFQTNEGKRELSRVLSKVAIADFKDSKSLLSAVVVLDNIGYPGKGFFRLANRMGKFQYTEDKFEQVLFFADEVRDVYKYWQGKS